MKNTILILVLCLFIGSCKDSLTVNEEVDTITASIEQEDEISLFDFVSQVRLIPLETTDSSLVAHITKIITSKDKIFIYDRIQNQIFIFNREGQFISKINRKGRGPEEYMSISDLAINPFNGCLEILDPWGKLLAFDLNGKYLHSFRLPKDLHAYDEFIPLSRDSIAFYSLSEPSTLNIYSRTTSKIVYSGFKSSKKLSINSPLSSFYRFRDTVYFSRYLYDDVFAITPTNIAPAYRWFFPGHKYDPNEVIPEYDRNNRKDYFAIQELLPYTHVNNLETDLYRYTCLSIRSGKTYVNVLHNKKTQRNIVFHKTKEGVIFTPYVLNDSIALGPIEPWRKKEEYLNEQVLDDENNQILNQLTEDSNPILIEYILKKE